MFLLRWTQIAQRELVDVLTRDSSWMPLCNGRVYGNTLPDHYPLPPCKWMKNECKFNGTRLPLCCPLPVLFPCKWNGNVMWMTVLGLIVIQCDLSRGLCSPLSRRLIVISIPLQCALSSHLSTTSLKSTSSSNYRVSDRPRVLFPNAFQTLVHIVGGGHCTDYKEKLQRSLEPWHRHCSCEGVTSIVKKIGDGIVVKLR